MRVLFLFTALALLAGTAAEAQVGSAAVHGLAGALSLRGRIESSSAHGCSRSHASTSVEADLELVVGATGAASLHLAATESRVFGPSLGAFRAGDHDFSYTTQLYDTRWNGRARHDLRTGELTIDFSHREHAELLLSGLGTAPLPPAVASAIAVRATCRVEDRDLLPSEAAVGEVARPTLLAVCTFTSGVPAPLDGYTTGEIVLGAGRGVRTVTHDPEWGSSVVALRSFAD